MVDIGGEGQKTDVDCGLVSGNLHAINVNAQPNISPGRVRLQIDAGEFARRPAGKEIPNLVNIGHWPPPEAASAEGFVPLEKAFSNLTTMEGAPVYPYHVAELHRVTSEKGWIVLSVDKKFLPQIEKLAQSRNGGTVWQLPKSNPVDNDRFVLPPQGLDSATAAGYRTLFEQANAHQVYDVAQAITLYQTGHSSTLSLDAVKQYAGPDGEVDFAALGRKAGHDEL